MNIKALSQSLENHSYCYLLPKQTYLNVDEDAARSLERKRNFIYCLVIQIMKAEKEMHIDNLVFRVRPCFLPMSFFMCDQWRSSTEPM